MNTRQPVAGELNRTFAVEWGLQVYYGTSALEVLDAAFNFNNDFSPILKTDYPATYVFPQAADEYKYIAIPQVWPGVGINIAMTHTLTGFNVPNTLQAPVTIQRNGVDTVYNIYRSDNKLGAAMDIAVASV
tara:strand:- start:274 stop:666 length:393 start_codon:yes stop_codon:yes gene_type:complete